mgnify:CR=1 FL=1
MIILNSNIIRTGIALKKRFIFDENYIKKYAKKDRLKWLIIGASALVLIIIVIIVILATRNNEPEEIDPAIPKFEVKEELVIEAGSSLPEVTDYFDTLENIDVDEIKITYPDEFELSYDTSLCTAEEVEQIYSSDEPNFDDYDCVENYLLTPATYGITIELQGEEYTVNLIIEDTREPVLILQNVEIYEGDTYELEDFISSCFDVTSECDIAYYTEDKDEDGNAIDYSNITEIGEHPIKIIATDDYGNTTEPIEATLTILEVEGNLYTVTFDSNGGSKIRSKRVGENGNVIKPNNPTREGYTFLGWYYNDEEFDFNTKITSDITLTAKWEEITEEEPGEGNSGGQGGGSQGPVNVTSISLNFKTIYLNIGETKTVTARVYPSNAVNRTVTWSSSNNNIATVSNGNITGVGSGTVTITATAGGKSASVEVIVSASSGGSCSYGNATYNTNAILSVDLTNNGCAVDPNTNPRETLSSSDRTRFERDLADMGIPLRAGYFSHTPTIQKIKNTSGTGLVGYQITVHVWVVDADNPYVRMEAQYILRPDGSRQFLTNNVCKNGICLNS